MYKNNQMKSHLFPLKVAFNLYLSSEAYFPKTAI